MDDAPSMVSVDPVDRCNIRLPPVNVFITISGVTDLLRKSLINGNIA